MAPRLLRNPFIILVGIAEYKNNHNLPAVMGDIRELKELWGNVFSSSNIHCINDELGNGGWNHTRFDLNKWLNDQRSEIEAAPGGTYDGLLLFISGHGNADYVACSDGGQLRVDDMVRKFNQNNLSHLGGCPKLFYVDSCRGHNEISPNTGVVLSLNRGGRGGGRKGGRKGGREGHTVMRYPNPKSDVMIHFGTMKENVAKTNPDEKISYFMKEVIAAFKRWLGLGKSLSFISIHINQALNVSSYGCQTSEIVSNLTYEVKIVPRN